MRFLTTILFLLQVPSIFVFADDSPAELVRTSDQIRKEISLGRDFKSDPKSLLKILQE